MNDTRENLIGELRQYVIYGAFGKEDDVIDLFNRIAAFALANQWKTFEEQLPEEGQRIYYWNSEWSTDYLIPHDVFSKKYWEHYDCVWRPYIPYPEPPKGKTE